jgi:hypothetical protein
MPYVDWLITDNKIITFDPETQKHTVAFVSHTQMNKTDKNNLNYLSESLFRF